MRYWYFLLFSFLVVSANAQFIYVKSWQESIGGWIVSPEGETIYEIPAGWRPEEHNAPMAEIEAWPLLLLWQKSGEPSRYAFITEDLKWQAVNGYNTVKTLGKSRFSGFSRNRNQVVLLNGKAEKLSQDSFRVINEFNQYSVTIAGNEKPQYGVIDTAGHWLISPEFIRLTDLGQNRYIAYDSLENSCLLQLNREAARWDTLVELTQKGWEVNSRWDYSEGSNYTWVKLPDRRYHFIDINGELVGDTIVGDVRYAVTEGIGKVKMTEGYHYIDQGGVLNEIPLPAAIAYHEGYALVEDPISRYLGYLNRKGEWAIKPNYCYATSFRNGRAIVAPAIPENCSTLIRGRGGDRHIPPSLNHTRRVRAYQLIDTVGNVIWADSCRELYLPAEGVVGINYTYNQLSPAIAIKWLDENRSWISPGFTVSRWSQLDSLNEHTIKSLNLGVRRFDELYDQTFRLPEDFVDRLSQKGMQQLEELNLNAHLLTPEALEAIFALPELRKLSLGYNSLEVLPAAIRQLDQLEVLDLSGTKFTSLPKAVYRMRHLQKLVIINTALPAETIPRLRKALPDTEIVFKYEW